MEFLTLSRYSFLSSIIPSESFKLQPVSTRVDAYICCSSNTCTIMGVSPLENVADDFKFASPAVGFLTCSSWIDCEMGGRWPSNCWFLKYCHQNIFGPACNILEKFTSSFFSMRFFNVQWCIHTIILTELRRNPVLSHEIDQILI